MIASEMINKAMKKHEEINTYINKILSACLKSDDICASVIGIDKITLMMWLKPNGIPADIADKIRMCADLNACDARPSYLSTLDGCSANFAIGIMKLRKIVSAFCPVVENDDE